MDFELQLGEIHAIVGENGAGKSTLVKILSGAIQPSAGTLELYGQPVGLLTPWHALRLGIASVYQERDLVPQLTAAENILLGIEPRRLGFIRGRLLLEQAKVLLQQVGVEIPLNVPVGQLGAAEQQLVDILKSVCKSPASSSA
ncbi:ATP-binding cassette domain-containing protein [Carboxydochorda subterranea]|uniref:ATP-binding cassette domain-containing protein n=1 Tax=Carboxydichorda subterranea TaxID=3109565 RepID=A0ABZ1BX73_9FIRM|nr:ATP-binding cassette domain-containing protein [Limnochorda sp. L945t]WRP17303.1 ATP-binding cassette domain-containing protein [Limnochorda sp. L945t]